MYNNYIRVIDNSHHEARLIKIVEIFILNPIFHTYISYQLEPRVYKAVILTESPLEVICTRKTRLELRMASYKAICPLLADALRATHHKEEVGHIFHPFNPG